MNDWQLYEGGAAAPHDLVRPAAPPWRQFRESTEEPGTKSTFQDTPAVVEAVNAALVLRRPLLLTGRPGSGKSSLIDSVARELRLGPVLRWHVTSRSTLDEALYRYDAIGRLQDRSLDDTTPSISRYLRLGPLGTALLPSSRPRALLIDEIDKSDIDLPNDLLNVFERGEFEIPELARYKDTSVEVREYVGDQMVTIAGGEVRCSEFPFVVLTNNGERDFPVAFLRRCIRLQMPKTTVTLLTDIIKAHLGEAVAQASADLIKAFAETSGDRPTFATDQLMNAVYVVSREVGADDDERRRITALLLKELKPDPA